MDELNSRNMTDTRINYWQLGRDRRRHNSHQRRDATKLDTFVVSVHRWCMWIGYYLQMINQTPTVELYSRQSSSHTAYICCAFHVGWRMEGHTATVPVLVIWTSDYRTWLHLLHPCAVLAPPLLQDSGDKGLWRGWSPEKNCRSDTSKLVSNFWHKTNIT